WLCRSRAGLTGQSDCADAPGVIRQIRCDKVTARLQALQPKLALLVRRPSVPVIPAESRPGRALIGVVTVGFEKDLFDNRLASGMFLSLAGSPVFSLGAIDCASLRRVWGFDYDATGDRTVWRQLQLDSAHIRAFHRHSTPG